MKAIVIKRYGSPDVLSLEEIQIPKFADDEVLIKVMAASLNAADWHVMRADPVLVRFMFGFTKPRFNVLGSDVAGVVEAVGKNVNEFKVGDKVFGNLFDDGGGRKGFGAFAEYASARADAFVHLPPNLSWEEAAAIPLAGITAIQALRTKGRIKAGEKVLVDGASGGVGAFAVQIAKAFEAEVTAVCSTSKIAFAKKTGADHVIDYTKEDFTKTGTLYDLVIGANAHHPIPHYKRALTATGRYVGVGGTMSSMMGGMILGPILTERDGKKLMYLTAKHDKDDLLFLRGLAMDEKLKPYIDRTYSLEEAPEAMRHLEKGHAFGKIVLRIDSE